MIKNSDISVVNVIYDCRWVYYNIMLLIINLLYIFLCLVFIENGNKLYYM